MRSLPGNRLGYWVERRVRLPAADGIPGHGNVSFLRNVTDEAYMRPLNWCSTPERMRNRYGARPGGNAPHLIVMSIHRDVTRPWFQVAASNTTVPLAYQPGVQLPYFARWVETKLGVQQIRVPLVVSHHLAAPSETA